MDKKKRIKEKYHEEATTRLVFREADFDKKRVTTMPDLRIDWPKFIVFFNATLDKRHSVIPRLRSITPSKNGTAQHLVHSFGSKAVLVEAALRIAFSCDGTAAVRLHAAVTKKIALRKQKKCFSLCSCRLFFLPLPQKLKQSTVILP